MYTEQTKAWELALGVVIVLLILLGLYYLGCFIIKIVEKRLAETKTSKNEKIPLYDGDVEIIHDIDQTWRD